MASISLQTASSTQASSSFSRSLTHLFRSSSSSHPILLQQQQQSSSSSSSSSTATVKSAIGSLRSKLISYLTPSLIIIPTLLRAAPKQRTSRRVKRIRNLHGTKHLPNLKNIVPCPFCGEPNRMHHLCEKCFKGMVEEEKGLFKGLLQKLKQ